MGTILKLLTILLGTAVIGAALIVFQATNRTTAQCPPVAPPSMSVIQIGAALSGGGAVTIDNADATALARALVGDEVDDLRVCFDGAGGHASGKIAVGPLNIPFYATALRVDLSGRTPRVTDFDFQIGSLPAAATDLVESRAIEMINENLETIPLNRRYTYQLGNGTLTIKAN